eukprot:TRINITY_DN16790_c0_g1_i1.p1 TRINITY_DN16790_c0_g1~~TRINITY_DN16790_c0_g1_i1.p1  ORF type:complete len:624 (+),score=123.11 TRINITY_DN16790_c0_g1_i1:33-1904(+)
MLKRMIKRFKSNPWVDLGGRLQSLNGELEIGLYELQNGVGEGMWVDKGNLKRAAEMGGVIEEYARATLAPVERCRFWERFREDMEHTVKGVMHDESAKVLMMGGVAQGMAAVDGDVDLTIFLPAHLERIQTDRSYLRSILHLIGRALKKQGFDGFVVPARVPIIQYRPDPDIERLFTLRGSDNVFRFLIFKELPNAKTAKSVVASLSAMLNVSVKLHESPVYGFVLEFPQAADAFSAMFRMSRTFAMPHLLQYPNPAKRTASTNKLFAHATGDSETPPNTSPTPPTTNPQGIVTIDDILKTAAEGRSVSTGAYTPYPFSVDISVAVTEHPWGPRNSELLRRYLSSDTKVRTLAMFVKWWSKHSIPVAINNSRSGWLTSYCVLVMLIHFLIHEGRLKFIEPFTIDPVLEPDTRYPENERLTDEDKVQITRDFIRFCEYYATGFDYDKEVISLVTGTKKTRDKCTAKVMSARNTCIVIEDPYEDRSLGHPINETMLLKIRATFLAGARSMISRVMDTTPEGPLLPELQARGRHILDEYYEFPNAPKDKSCSICKAKEAVESNIGNTCEECEDALKQAKTPIEFFSARTGKYAGVQAEVHIREQKRQERALKEHTFLKKNHKSLKN